MKTNPFLDFFIFIAGILSGSAIISYFYNSLNYQGFWEIENNIALFSTVFFIILSFSLYFFWRLIKKNQEFVYIKDSILATGIFFGITTSVKALFLLLIFN